MDCGRGTRGSGRPSPIGGTTSQSRNGGNTLQGKINRVSDHPEGLHVVRERAIAETGAVLRRCNRLIDRDRCVVGEKLHEPENFPQRLARLMTGQNDIRHSNCPGIDEGIARDALFALQLNDRIEGAARRLPSNAAPEPVADHAERDCQRENLGDALNRKRNIGIAGANDTAVRINHGESECVGIGTREFRNIGRDFASIRPLPHLLGDFLYDTFKLGHVENPLRDCERAGPLRQ